MAISPSSPYLSLPATHLVQPTDADFFPRKRSPPPVINRLDLFEIPEKKAGLDDPFDPTLKHSYSFSPRIASSTIHDMTLYIAEYLHEKCEERIPPPLFHVLAQTYYNQYDPLSPDGCVLVAALARMGLLEPCLIAIQQLTVEKNPFTQALSISVLKLGLEIIKQSALQYVFDEQFLETLPKEMQLKAFQLRGAIEDIFTISEQEQFEGFTELIQRAKAALQSKCSLDLVREGLNLFDPRDLKCILLPLNEPFYEQKLFLFAVKRLLIEQPNLSRLDEKKKEALLECTLSCLTAPDALNFLLTDAEMNNASQSILQLSWDECRDPNTPRRVQLIESILRIPPISLEQLQLLMMWTQGGILPQDAESIIAGSRQEDPTGNLYRFAIYRYQKLTKQAPGLDLLKQLLKVIFDWKSALANQELLEGPTVESASHCQESEPPAERQLFLSERLPISSLDFSMIKREESAFFPWRSRAIADSALSYLLSGKEVTVADLALYKPFLDPPSAVSMQIKRFNQITQFFINRFFDKGHTPDNIQDILGTLRRAEKMLLKEGAFEPARAIRAIFNHASIDRLKGAFRPSLFKAPKSWCSSKGKFKKLKALQEAHPHPYESLSLVLNELAETKEIPRFTGVGEVHLHRLKLLGDIFNRFVLRNGSSRSYWYAVKIKSDSLLMQAFSRQTGRLEDDEDDWWARSQEIHAHLSPYFWGRKKDEL